MIAAGLAGGETVVTDGQLLLSTARESTCAPPKAAGGLIHEHLGNLHSPPGDDDADDRVAHRLRRLRLPAAAGRGAAGGRLSRPSRSPPSLPGASPETMAASVAAPIERQFSTIAGISSMTSSSSLGNTAITIQFDLDRNIDGAALDVQTALAVAQRRLPAEMTDAAVLPQGQSRRLPGALSVACAPTPCRCRRSTNTPRPCWRRRFRNCPASPRCWSMARRNSPCACRSIRSAAAARNISLDDVRNVVAKANSDRAGRHAVGPERKR